MAGKTTRVFEIKINGVSKAVSGTDKLSSNLQKVEVHAGKTSVKTIALGSALGDLARKGLDVVIAQLRVAVASFLEFERTMSKVKAISGATDKEFRSLSQQAQKLGGSTRYTAAQVAKLQVEYAKLGFSVKEINAASEATLNLATISGDTLAGAAEVAGSTIRAFSLDAEETGRVVDVMAGAFTSSALDMESFREAMKLVAPVAETVGISIEETTALLSVLADRGIKGSLAGTALRNTFLNLADSNSKLSQKAGVTVRNFDDLMRAFENMNDPAIDFSEIIGVTDRRMITAFQTFLKTTDQINKTAEALKNVDGAAQEMAEGIEDNTIGALIELTSAFEAFVAVMAKMGGISLGVKGSIDILAKMFRFMATGKTTVDNLTEAFADFKKEVRSQDLNELFATARFLRGVDAGSLGLTDDEFSQYKSFVGDRIRTLQEGKRKTSSTPKPKVKKEKKGRIDSRVDFGNSYDAIFGFSTDADRPTPLDSTIDTGEGFSTEFDRPEVDLLANGLQTSQVLLNFALNALAIQSNAIRDQIESVSRASQASVSRVQSLENELSSSSSARRLKLLSEIDQEKKKQEDLANTKIALEKKYRRQQKNLAIGQSVINTALGITNAFATTVPAPAAPALAALIAATGAAQLATISSQKFAKGGHLNGPSHRRGGIKGTGSFAGIEVEGGEFIMNKAATAMFKPQLEAMNSYKYEDGGMLYPNPDNLANIRTDAATAADLDRLGDRISRMRPVVSVQEINRVQDRVEVIERSLGF